MAACLWFTGNGGPSAMVIFRLYSGWPTAPGTRGWARLYMKHGLSAGTVEPCLAFIPTIQKVS